MPDNSFIFDLYLVTDEKASKGRDLISIVKQAIEGGVNMVQLREKKINTRQFVEKALALKKLLKPYNIPLIINDRVDIALAVGADGIHIGQTDMPFELLKKIAPKNMIIGLSVETFDQAKEAENFDLDYLGVSPVFSTPTKTGFEGSPWGLSGLKKLRSLSRHKLIAIGGISQLNVASVIEAGADGVAVVSAVCSADNPKTASEEIINIIKSIKNSNR